MPHTILRERRERLASDNRSGAHLAEPLLTIEEACRSAATYVVVALGSEVVPLYRAVGRSLSRDAKASRDIPPYDQSAMDGYAVRSFCDAPSGLTFRVADRIVAGTCGRPLLPGEAARIMTGAPLPAGADAVVMQENVGRFDDRIVLGVAAKRGEHVRQRAEDVSRGDLLVEAGRRLDPRHIALLAAQGHSTVRVARRPRIAIISSGTELVSAASGPVTGARLYDSNGPMLLGLMFAAGFDVTDMGCHPDDPARLSDVMRNAARSHDLVVTTGGVSVGEEDHSARALAMAGGLGDPFHLRMKPGKPALLGRIASSVYLGLPGNPVSALLSWTLLGGAVVAALEGRHFQRPIGHPLPLEAAMSRKPGRTEFVPAKLVDDDGATRIRLLSSGSARLTPLREADGIVEIPHDLAAAAAGANLRFVGWERLLVL